MNYERRGDLLNGREEHTKWMCQTNLVAGTVRPAVSCFLASQMVNDLNDKRGIMKFNDENTKSK